MELDSPPPPSQPPSPPPSPPFPPDHDKNKFQTHSPSSSSVPLPRIEDCTVYDYIDGLSPIKPVNYTNGDCALPQSSVSLPPAKPSEILSHVSGKKPETPTIGSEENKDEATLEAEKLNHLESGGEIIADAKSELPQLATELCQSLKYDSGGPESSYNAEVQSCGFERTGAEVCPGGLIADISRNPLYDSELDLDQLLIDQTRETLGYDWDKIFSEAAGLLACFSPSKEDDIEELGDKSSDSGMVPLIASVSHEHSENMLELQSPYPVTTSGDLSVQVPSTTQPQVDEVAQASSQRQPAHCSTIVADKSHDDFSSEVHNKPFNQQEQVIRKSCLVFEVSGTHYRKITSDSAGTKSIPKQSVSGVSPNEPPCVPGKPRSTKVSAVLPGIGLHLNALAASTRDKIIVKQDAVTRKRQLISAPSAMVTFGSTSSNTKAITEKVPDHADKKRKQLNTDLQVTEGGRQNSEIGECEVVNHSSSRKKRRKTGNAGEADGCKLCHCKRSKCLKLYCECFAAGLYCAETCTCLDCFNRPAFEETVLQTRRQIETRNPLAFAPKVIKVSDSSNNWGESSKTPASARHKRGCNCKKSGCLKRYCECFEVGVGCSSSCRCEGCKNSFGQKGALEDPVVDGIEGSEKSATDASLDMVKDKREAKREDVDVMPLQTRSASKREDVDVMPLQSRSASKREDLDEMPLQNRGPIITLPFHFGRLSSQVCSFSSGSSSLRPCSNQNQGKSSGLSDRHDGGTLLEMIPENETNINCISPNRKRISPPCRGTGSPAWKTSRKLILKSISSFPTVDVSSENEKLEG